HVRRGVLVDRPRQLVPEWNVVALRVDRTVDRFPRLELVRRAAFAAEDRLEATELAHRDDRLPVRRALKWTLEPRERTRRHRERVRIGVDVHFTVAREVDRVRLEDPSAAEVVGVLQLQCERLPAARRRALELPRI